MQEIKENWYRKFRLYLSEKKVNKSKFSKRLGTTRLTIHNLVNEVHYPRKALFEKINIEMGINHPYTPDKKTRKTFLIK